MISKHIRNPDAKAAKHRRIIKLVEYILNPQHAGSSLLNGRCSLAK